MYVLIITHQLNCFYDNMTAFMDEGRELDAIFLSFSKASDPVSHNTLVSTVGCYGLDGWTIRWMEH